MLRSIDFAECLLIFLGNIFQGMMNGKINGQLSVEDSSHNSVSTKETTFEYGSKYQLHTQDKLTTNKTSSDFDSLDEEAERRSVLHYDIGYNKNNVTCFRGTLTFALRYDHIHRVLMVHIIRANHLPKKVSDLNSCNCSLNDVHVLSGSIEYLQSVH